MKSPGLAKTNWNINGPGSMYVVNSGAGKPKSGEADCTASPLSFLPEPDSGGFTQSRSSRHAGAKKSPKIISKVQLSPIALKTIFRLSHLSFPIILFMSAFAATTTGHRLADGLKRDKKGD